MFEMTKGNYVINPTDFYFSFFTAKIMFNQNIA